MRFKTVFLDLDGTIADTQVGITNGVRYAAKKMNIFNVPYTRIDLFIGPSIMQFCKNHLSLSDEDATTFTSYLREYYIDNGIQESTLYDGMIDLMDNLRSKGTKVYICTGKYHPSAVKMAIFHDLERHCDGIMGSTEKLTEKVDILRVMMHKYNADCETSVMVGDRYTDIDGAKGSNCASVGVLYGYGTKVELESCGSDYIAATVKDLSNYLLS